MNMDSFENSFNQQFSLDDFLSWEGPNMSRGVIRKWEGEIEGISAPFHSWGNKYSQFMPCIAHCCPHRKA